MKNDVIHKPEVHNVFATPPEEDRATAICNRYKNLVKFSLVIFELCKRTDILITILGTPTGGKLICMMSGYLADSVDVLYSPAVISFQLKVVMHVGTDVDGIHDGPVMVIVQQTKHVTYLVNSHLDRQATSIIPPSHAHSHQ